MKSPEYYEHDAPNPCAEWAAVIGIVTLAALAVASAAVAARRTITNRSNR